MEKRRWRIRVEKIDSRRASDRNWEGEDAARTLNRAPQDPGTPEEGRTRLQIGPFFTHNPLPRKQVDMLRDIAPKFSDELLRQLIKTLRTNAKFPLHIFNWLVTNYSKTNTIMVIVKDNDGNETARSIHGEYTSQRWANRKRHFDFFCKRCKVAFELDGTIYETSVTQLNIFLFAKEMHLFSYVREHSKEILQHYNEVIRAAKEAKASGCDRVLRGKKRKRVSELTKAVRDPIIIAPLPTRTRHTLNDAC